MNRAESAKKAAVGIVAGIGGFAGFCAGTELVHSDLSLGAVNVSLDPELSANGDNLAVVDLGPVSIRDRDLGLDVPFAGAKITIDDVALAGNKPAVNQVSETLTALAGGSAEIVGELKRQYIVSLGMFGALGALGAGGVAEFARRRRYGQPLALATLLVANTALPAYDQVIRHEADPVAWQQVSSLLPDSLRSTVLETFPAVGDVEVSGSYPGLQGLLAAIVDDKIVRPGEFINKASQNLGEQIAAELPAKQPGAVRMVVISDEHANAAFGPYFHAAVQAYDADIALHTGDIVSSGSWAESFFASEIQKSTSNAPFQVYVWGNHDGAGSMKPFEKAGAIELNGKPVNVAGLEFIGIRDNYSSTIGMARRPIGPSTEEEQLRLAGLACAQPVNVVVAHNPQLLAKVVKKGCGEANIAGHVHASIDPELLENANKTRVLRWVNGSSTGPESAFSYGAPMYNSTIGLVEFTPNKSPNANLPLRLSSITVATLTPKGVVFLETTHTPSIYTPYMQAADTDKKLARVSRNIPE